MEDHTEQAESKLHFGGLPTGPEVKKLKAAFPNIAELRGSVIAHERLEDILGYGRDSNRYRTVVTAWRKSVERDTGVVISGRESRGQGYTVLLDGEQVSFGVKERKSAGRKIRRSFSAIHATDASKLSPEQKAVRHHELMFIGKLHGMLAEARKAVPLPAAVKA